MHRPQVEIALRRPPRALDLGQLLVARASSALDNALSLVFTRCFLSRRVSALIVARSRGACRDRGGPTLRPGRAAVGVDIRSDRARSSAATELMSGPTPSTPMEPGTKESRGVYSSGADRLNTVGDCV
jgi:hypothetical protein